MRTSLYGSQPPATPSGPPSDGLTIGQALADAPRPLPVSAEVKSRTRVLIVDDEATLRENCANVLGMEGYAVTVSARGAEARDLLARRSFDVALVDLYMAEVDGRTLLRTALETNPATLVVVMTGDPSLESCLEVLQAGAWDYLPKPFSAAHLQVLIGRAAHTVMVARETEASKGTVGLGAADRPVTQLGSSPAFRRAVELARRVAATDAAVLITGESGSGKELLARFTHQHSRRATRPFVMLNCRALPEQLLESEMFGHVAGAFPGAVRDKVGLLEAANGGTLFIDDLVDIPKSTQAKLLRVLQDGVVRRGGSDEDAVVNVRIISATNRDPEDAVRRGDLREDLFYRLRVVPVHLPPLRERTEDIPLLADYFFNWYWAKRRIPGTPPPEFTEAALRALAAHPWRGNIRELQNVMEHVAVVTEPGLAITERDLPLRDEPHAPNGDGQPPLASSAMEVSYHAARDRVIAQFEVRYLGWLLQRAAGNMSEAARIAGVDRTTLYRLMERHGLHREPNAGLVSERPSPARVNPTYPSTPVALAAHGA
jgi:DNA-binding NtrC family response regulator